MLLAQFNVTLRDGVNGYGGTRDVMLQDSSGTYGDPDANYDAVDDSVDGFPFPRATLMRFDVTSIPAGTLVVSAQLTLNVANGSTNSFPAYQLLRPWSAAQANWYAPLAGMTWAGRGATGLGVDRDTAVLFVADSTPPYAFTDAGVAVLQSWVDLPARNLGFVIQEFANNDALNLRHCDFGTAGSRPQLTVTLSDGGSVVFRHGVSPTAGYSGCSDTTLSGAPPVGGNANGWGLVVSGGGPLGSSLVAFDTRVLPVDATVSSAQLRLFGTDDAPFVTFSTYEVLRPWVELEATWTTWASGMPWTSPAANGAGADRGTTSIGGGNASRGPNTYNLNATGVQLVQDWIRGVKPNRGLVLINLSANNRMAWLDRETANVAERPALVITLTSPTWDGGFIFDGGSAEAGVDAGSDAGSTDAGSADAGSADAGVLDAGLVVDAGSSDAGGAADAGATGGGVAEPGAYSAGCGCGTAGVPWPVILLLSGARALRSAGASRRGATSARPSR